QRPRRRQRRRQLVVPGRETLIGLEVALCDLAVEGLDVLDDAVVLFEDRADAILVLCTLGLGPVTGDQDSSGTQIGMRLTQVPFLALRDIPSCTLQLSN